MNQTKLDKIKHVFLSMDDDYWASVTTQSAALSGQAKQVIEDINNNLTKLAIIQLDILNTKYKGYQQMIEPNEEIRPAAIIKENKDWIDKLTQQKEQIVTAIIYLQAALNPIIETIQSVGETPDGEKR